MTKPFEIHPIFAKIEEHVRQYDEACRLAWHINDLCVPATEETALMYAVRTEAEKVLHARKDYLAEFIAGHVVQYFKEAGINCDETKNCDMKTEYWYLREGDFLPEPIESLCQSWHRSRQSIIEFLSESNNIFRSKEAATETSQTIRNFLAARQEHQEQA